MNNYYGLVAQSSGARICPRIEEHVETQHIKKHSNTITAMRHKTPTTILGYTIVILAIGAAASHTMTTEAHGDHVDRHIWIETAEGNFITATEKALNKIDEIFEGKDSYLGTIRNENRVTDITHTVLDVLWGTEDSARQEVVWGKPQTTIDDNQFKLLTINNVAVIDQRRGECGDKTTEEEYYKSLADLGKTRYNQYERIEATDYHNLWSDETEALFDDDGHFIGYTIEFDEFDKPLVGELRYKSTAIEIKQTEHQKHHEKICGYWYSNVVKDEYTYTILDLPRDREIPPDYNGIVKAGVEAGLNSWAKINNMTFAYTDNRLEADIIIQQQIYTQSSIFDTGVAYGNAEIGCLFDNKQCTIQLFTDLNVHNQQTLTNKHSIAWTTAHEFGHLIGLPHHIDPDHIMNTVHSDNVRTYYEARNINVVKAPEPTYEQRLLGYDETDTTEDSNISEIIKNEKFTEFVEYITQVIRNAQKDDRFDLGVAIIGEINDRIANAIFN